ncbi:SDR family oxidoreductase [Undibacterium terreum]|uniref:Oxidoreductase n=1 Tax=Undibacterium terreum TaxID=1224302 RepID=A0A916U6Z5_9BURK|nr:SDR family oxidoreductase [Undibacterium terreum]GGC62929.1 oxidoreductase [Undibacterium terreum]
MTEKKIAVVTGSSRGIGAATVRLLASQGYGVCINYVANGEAAEELLAEIKAVGVPAIAVQADTSQEAEVVRLFKTVDDQLGRVSALVNNAGILATQMRVEDMDAARINRILSTNVTGYFLSSREAIRRMSPRHGGQGGSIVNVSSAASRIGSPGEYVDYAASKGAVDTLTTGLALELAAENIRVNCVRPGIIYTDIHASGGEPGRVDRVKANIPMQRGGSADEVAQAIAWLLSDAASYSTGAFIDVSGGR